MTNSVPIIDADAHVIETERTWDYLGTFGSKVSPEALFRARRSDSAILGHRRQDRRFSLSHFDRARAS